MKKSLIGILVLVLALGMAVIGCGDTPGSSSGLEFTPINNGAAYSVKWDGSTSITNVIIPTSYNDKPVTSIGSFSSCTSLTSITIPDSVILINQGAFTGCSSLTSVTIGNSVTSILPYAFWYCTSLTSVEFKGTAITTSWSPNAFPGTAANNGGTALWNAYSAGGAGVYTRPSTTSGAWAKR